MLVSLLKSFIVSADVHLVVLASGVAVAVVAGGGNVASLDYIHY